MSTEVKVREGRPAGWQGYWLSAGEISLGIAPQIGGRIISLTHRGEELLFVQPEHRGEEIDLRGVEDLRAHKRRLGFRLWGGDKTWVSPQSAWWEGIPPLDLDAGAYETRLDGGVVRLTSPVCRETGLRVVRCVELRESGEVFLDQELHNPSDREIRRGIWDVTQCLRPFDVWVPGTAMRAYPEEGDSVSLRGRVLHEEDGWSRIRCREAAHFKFGGRVDRGLLVALRPEEGETLAFVRRFAVEPSGAYAHDAAVEVYNSPNYDYCEIEVHAPLVTLVPGGRVAHRQRWRIERLGGSLGPRDALGALGVAC